MNQDEVPVQELRGPLAYMARNGIAANLLMFFMVAAGLLSMNAMVQEVFPFLAFNHIEVSVPYPGAAPEEVEESIVRKIEEQVEAIEYVKEVTAVAARGVASVMVELKTGADVSRGMDEVESAVNRIQTFPAGAERPKVRQMTNRQSVMRLVLYGDVPERALKEQAYRVEDAIAALPAVSYVDTSGVRNYEISIEVSLRRLRAFGLTLSDISDAVRNASLDLSAGSIETLDAEVRLRTTGRNYDQQDFENIIILGRSDGTVVRLGDIAEVRDGFQDADLLVRYQGKPAAFIEVYRSAGEQVLEVVEAVREHLGSEVAPSLPAGMAIDIWSNDAVLYEDRLRLLTKNGSLGLLLVLVSLTIFLEIRLALWVAAGIGISFIGALAVMLPFGVTLNVVSLFSFIIAVGIVVDDAIVVSEHIYTERQGGVSGTSAAVRGVQRVKRPVIFAVLTTVAAFSPMLFASGALGELLAPIPIVMISVLILSLVESLLVLPNHLSHLPGPDWKPSHFADRFFSRIRGGVNRGFKRFVDGPLDRGLRLATGQPAVVLAGGLGMLILSSGLVYSGIIGVVQTQPVESDIVTANLEMPEGTPARRTDQVARELEAAGRRAIDRLSAGRPGDAEPLLDGVHVGIGMEARQELGPVMVREAGLIPLPHIATVQFKLLETQRRDFSAGIFLQTWREEVGLIPEARSLTFSTELFDFGKPVHIDLSHPDPDRLAAASAALVDDLREFQGVYDVSSDLAASVREIRLELRPEARTLGLTLDELAQQVRGAFFGEEALRVQRGREEVRVYVRLPAPERDAIADLEAYLVRTPAGVEVPLSRVASLHAGMSPGSINRKGGKRVVSVTADVDTAAATGSEVSNILANTTLADLTDADPGLSYRFGGEQQEQDESLDAMGRSFVLALLVIYALLAIPLGSYTQPLIIMAVIPFGIIGAILGHLVMGLNLDLTSVMGMIGLSGVVVNDSLMMIDFINRRRQEGMPAKTAIIDGAKARFRPIFITSVTTFLGFTPLILERDIQAQLLVPLGVSMGFGIVFATVVLMLLVPALAMLYFRVLPQNYKPAS